MEKAFSTKGAGALDAMGALDLEHFFLREMNTKVALAIIFIQLTVSTVYYFSAMKATYMRLINRELRRPVFNSSDLPSQPLRALLGTICASLALTAAINYLAVRFGIDSWEEGLRMAAVLLLVDTCLNARHHFFEGRPLGLFLLHLGYHAIMLVSTCCLVSVFGHPLINGRGLNSSLGSGNSGGGGSGMLSEAGQQHAAAAAVAAAADWAEPPGRAEL